MSRCASDCGRSRCSRCIARAGRRRRWRPIGTHARRSWRRSAWSPALSCGTCMRRSSARIPRLEPPDAVDATGLPPELDTATPLVGRRPIWSGCVGTGGARSPVTAGSCWSPVSAAIGKTRLVAELAARCCRTAESCGTALPAARRRRRARLAAARAAREPTLLVLDDVGERARSDRRAMSPAGGSAVLVVATAEQAVPARCGPPGRWC